MAHGPLALCIVLCLLGYAPVATAQQAESDAVAPTVNQVADAPAAPPSGGEQATGEEQTDEDPQADRTANETDPSALTEFRPALDPYGVWVQHPTWGLVWVPNSAVVGPQFVPYVTSGHWALSEDGEWIWVSDFPFGWAVFHYGRWVSISGVGWAWIPGARYAPAWVEWRIADPGYAYVGWGALSPSWIWVNGTAVAVWQPPPTVYVFCPSHYVFHHRPYVYLVRDPMLVGRLGHHTHRYAPGYARYEHRRSGPSIAEARIPSDAVPRHRVASSARLHRSLARQRVSDRAPRRVRTAAEPTPARASSRGGGGRPDRALNSASSRRSRVATGARPTPEGAAASRTRSVGGRSGRDGTQTPRGRTAGRFMRGRGPSRGFVSRGIPSRGARPRR
jgi:hypothetical protein